MADTKVIDSKLMPMCGLSELNSCGFGLYDLKEFITINIQFGIN